MTERLPHVLGPTTRRNWSWILVFAVLAVVFLAAAAEATLRLGPGWRETAVPFLIALPFGLAGVWTWRQPPFERTTVSYDRHVVEIAGRRTRVRLKWSEIAAVTLRPSSMGPAHMTIEKAASAEASTAEDPVTPAGFLAARAERSLDGAPGVMFPVKAVGVSAEEIVLFLARGADSAGYRLEEPGWTDRRAVHRFPGPRRWSLLPR